MAGGGRRPAAGGGPEARTAAGSGPRAEVGYGVRSDRHRRGYATEAVGALTSAAFRHLRGLGAVEVRMDRANVASAGVPAKLGFALAGEEDRDVLTPGQSGRGLVWQLTRRAWEDRRRPWAPGPR